MTPLRLDELSHRRALATSGVLIVFQPGSGCTSTNSYSGHHYLVHFDCFRYHNELLSLRWPSKLTDARHPIRKPQAADHDETCISATSTDESERGIEKTRLLVARVRRGSVIAQPHSHSSGHPHHYQEGVSAWQASILATLNFRRSTMYPQIDIHRTVDPRFCKRKVQVSNAAR